eukprot:1994224-Pyramimonas_sp.AAC.1
MRGEPPQHLAEPTTPPLRREGLRKRRCPASSSAAEEAPPGGAPSPATSKPLPFAARVTRRAPAGSSDNGAEESAELALVAEGVRGQKEQKERGQ